MPKIFPLSFLVLAALVSAQAQPAFKAYPSEEKMMEGGTASLLIIETDHGHFALRVPREYGAQVRAIDQTIIFSSQNDSSVITLKMSTNYAGKLPRQDELRDIVVKKFASASFARASACYTSCGAGSVFEFFQPAAGSTTIRIKDAYLPFADGSFEFTLKCDSRDYEKCHLSFDWLLNSFRLQADTGITQR